MREIEFRAWDVLNKEMLFDVQNTYDYGCNNDNKVMESRFADLLKNGNYIIEQFTGLHDKNGKEIYEGDVVIQREEVLNPRTHTHYHKPRFIERKGIIVFQDGCFDFKGDRYTGQIRCYMGYGKKENQLEIIGNVHEGTTSCHTT